jgi:hypothetical protein
MLEGQTVWHPISPVLEYVKNKDAGTDPVLDQADAVQHFLGPVTD